MPLRRLLLVRRLPIISKMRRRITRARRNRRHDNWFNEGIADIDELAGQFDEWRARWIARRDTDARRKAEQSLARIYVLIRRLSRNSHHRELVLFLRRSRIPGWRRALAPNHARSR